MKQEDKVQVLQGVLYSPKGSGAGALPFWTPFPGELHIFSSDGKQDKCIGIWEKGGAPPLPNASHQVTQENSWTSIWAEAPACSRKMRKTTLVQERPTGASPLPSKREEGKENLLPSVTPQAQDAGMHKLWERYALSLRSHIHSVPDLSHNLEYPTTCSNWESKRKAASTPAPFPRPAQTPASFLSYLIPSIRDFSKVP